MFYPFKSFSVQATKGSKVWSVIQENLSLWLLGLLLESMAEFSFQPDEGRRPLRSNRGETEGNAFSHRPPDIF